jgi:hypothetical protein
MSKDLNVEIKAVPVLKTHIKRGVQGEPSSCALALALGHDNDDFVSVTRDVVFIDDKSYIPTPETVAWIDVFDGKKKDAQPFVAVLKRITEVEANAIMDAWDAEEAAVRELEKRRDDHC